MSSGTLNGLRVTPFNDYGVEIMLVDLNLGKGIVWMWLAMAEMTRLYEQADQPDFEQKLEAAEAEARETIEAVISIEPAACETGMSVLLTFDQNGTPEYTCLGDMNPRCPVMQTGDGVYLNLKDGTQRRLTIEPCAALQLRELGHLLLNMANQGKQLVLAGRMAPNSAVRPVLVNHSELRSRSSV